MFSILSFLLSLIGIAALCAACFLAGFFLIIGLMVHKYGAEKTKKAIDRLKEYLESDEEEDLDETEEISAE